MQVSRALKSQQVKQSCQQINPNLKLLTGWRSWTEGSLPAYFMSFFSRLVIKSLAFSEISSKASSSKSQVAEVTLARVSLSLSPMKGERPLSLRGRREPRLSSTPSS